MTSEFAATREKVLARLRTTLGQELRKSPETGTLDDPLLEALMRVLAAEVAALQTDQTAVRDGLLDELMMGLGVPPRSPVPAQAVITGKVSSRQGYHIPAGFSLRADTILRQEFRTDSDLWISAGRIAAAFAYYNRLLAPLAPEIYDSDRENREVIDFDPVPLRWGPGPELLLIIDDLPKADPSGLSVQIQTADPALQLGLRSSVWRIAEKSGEFLTDGILRVEPGRRGAAMLRWGALRRFRTSPGEIDSRPHCSPGPYSYGIFQFPVEPCDDDFECTCPRTLRQALAKSRTRAALVSDQFLGQPKLWIRISFGSYEGDLVAAVQRIRLHVASVSNLTLIDRSHTFAIHGRSFPVDEEGGARYAVAVNSLIGGEGGQYVDAYRISGDLGDGRYFLRRHRLDIEPATFDDGAREEPNVSVSLWTTAGPDGNGVPTGKIHAEIKEDDGSTVTLDSCVVSRGGSGGESASEASRRFAAAIVARGRAVTHGDIQAAARAFDDRITEVTVLPGLERTPLGLQRVYYVSTGLKDRFVSGDPEWSQLLRELEQHLQSLAALDVIVRVQPVLPSAEPADGDAA